MGCWCRPGLLHHGADRLLPQPFSSVQKERDIPLQQIFKGSEREQETRGSCRQQEDNFLLFQSDVKGSGLAFHVLTLKRLEWSRQ